MDINPGCHSLELLAGPQICINPPGGTPSVSAEHPEPTGTPAPVPADVADRTNTHCARFRRPDFVSEDCAAMAADS